MPHPDADDLALLALGESLGSAVDAHVAGCAECTSEIDSFRETIGLADLSNFGEDAPRPGEHVWQAIAAELGFSGAQLSAGSVATAFGDQGANPGPPVDTATGEPTAAPDRPAGTNGTAPPQLQLVPNTVPADTVPPDTVSPDTVSPTTVSTDTGRPDTGQPDTGHANDIPADHSADSGTGPGDRDLPSTVTPLTPRSAQPRRRSRWAAPLAAAVVGIAVGAGAVVVAQNRSNEVTIEAVAPLTPVVGGPLAVNPEEQLGKAELVAAPTGQEVVVTAADLPPSTNSYEVWLFGDEGRMVSLGTLSGGSGSFPVPEGYNTREYRVVDVSDEPPDGNPAHSGVSLIRGAFS